MPLLLLRLLILSAIPTTISTASLPRRYDGGLRTRSNFNKRSPGPPILTSATASHSTNLTNQNLDSPYPYEFPILAPSTDVFNQPFPMPQCNGVTLEEATIDQLQEAMADGRLTSLQICACFLLRILQVDSYPECVLSLPVPFFPPFSLEAWSIWGCGRMHVLMHNWHDNHGTQPRLRHHSYLPRRRTQSR